MIKKENVMKCAIALITMGGLATPLSCAMSSNLSVYYALVQSYQGRLLTKQSLPTIIKNELTVSNEVAEPLNRWCSKNKDLLQKLCVFDTDVITYSARDAELQCLVESHSGSSLLSKNSYIYPFELSCSSRKLPLQVFVKTASSKTRVYNWWAQAFHDTKDPRLKGEFEDLDDAQLRQLKASPTFQTISRGINQVQLTELCQIGNISDIIMPATIIAHVPGRPQEIEDNNYCVIQEKIPNLRSLSRWFYRLSVPMIRNLFFLVKYSPALWDVGGNLHGLVEGPEVKKLVLCDVEQVFVLPPSIFPQIDKGYIDYSVYLGLRGLLRDLILNKKSEQWLCLKTLIETDCDLPGSAYWQEIKEELSANVPSKKETGGGKGRCL